MIWPAELQEVFASLGRCKAASCSRAGSDFLVSDHCMLQTDSGLGVPLNYAETPPAEAPASACKGPPDGSRPLRELPTDEVPGGGCSSSDDEDECSNDEDAYSDDEDAYSDASSVAAPSDAESDRGDRSAARPRLQVLLSPQHQCKTFQQVSQPSLA